MSIQSPTGILDVTNATLRAGKLESTGDITCSSNLVVSGGFDLGAINSNADTVVDFTATRQLRKYPREILTSSSQNGYLVSNSAVYPAAIYNTASNAFIESVTGNGEEFLSASDAFSTSAPYDATANYSFNSVNGPWLKLKLPSAIELHSFEIFGRTVNGSHVSDLIDDGYVWASNDDSTWTQVARLNALGVYTNSRPATVHVGSNVAYSYFTIHITSVTTQHGYASVGEWKLYGYESTKGDGQDVRLRAHANAPNTDFLEVHFDANVSNSYPGSGTALTDLSGEAHHATLNNGVGFDSTYGALTFNGSNQNVNTQALGISGDFVHTASLWVKPGVNQSALSATDWSAFFYIGEEPNTAATQAIAISYRKDELRYWFGANDVDVTTDFKANEWVHLAFVYRGGGGTAVNKDVFVNGVKQRYLRTDGSSYGNALNVQSTAFLRLGAAWGTNAAPYQDFNGSIANFRLFKRPLIEAEIHQLYDWEKVRFGRVALGDVVAFRDGSLGVGVAEPSRDDRLVVDGRVKADSMKTPSVVDRNDVVVYEQTGPHDRPLVKYPEIAMTANSSGGYVASASSQYAGGDYDIWKAHDGERTHAGSPSYYYSSSHEIYSTTNGAYAPGSNPSYSTTSSGTAYPGEYVQMQFSTPIKLSYVRIVSASTSTYNKNAPEQGVICGSNDGTTWTTIAAYSGIRYSTLGASADIQASTVVAYTYIRLVVTHIDGTGGSGWLTMEEIEYYATEEGDVSTDSKLTSVLNKPGTQHLEVYWDGADSNSYPGAGTEVFDLSGNGLTGAMTGVEFDSVYNSFYFDTTNDDRITTTTSASGAYVHSVSMWVKFGELGSVQHYIAHLGTKGSTLTFAGMYYSDNHGIRVVIGNEYRTAYHPPIGEWIHVTYTYAGGTPDSTAGDVIVKFYVNGERVYFAGYYERATGALALPSSSVFQVTGSSDDSGAGNNHYESWVGNARLFSKALSAEQVKELYAYDAVRFGHRASNSVSLHEGNLGVGVAAPTSRFEVAGADGLFEYPPRGMTGHETYMEGQGVFRVSASSEYGPGGRDAWYAFDNSTGGWQQDGNSWDTNGTNYIGSASFEGASGEFIQLELPHPIKPKQVKLVSTVTNRMITDGILFGRDANNGTWRAIHTLTGYTTWSYNIPQYIGINATEYYDAFTLLVQKINGHTNIHIAGINFFGTPAPSTLDDGHLTLGKTLTTPRVSGHAAGAETPRAESLVLHYDTTVDSVVSGTTVVDTSGNGINATLDNGAAYSSSERALTFDSVNDHMTGTLNNPSGAWVHTVSCWYKPLSVDNGVVWSIGGNAVSKQIAVNNVNGTIYYFIYGCNSTPSPTTTFTTNKWHHIVAVFKNSETTATNGTVTGRELYIDGVKQKLTATNNQVALNFDANTTFRLANQYNAEYNHGAISNFKIWGGVALTADEITAEFALARTGKAINVTDTAVCLGGTAPRAQLDVRGTARFENITGCGFPTYSRTTWSGVTSTTIPLEPERFSVHKIFVRGKMTSPTGTATRRCRIRPKTEGNTAFMSGSMESWSHAHRRGSPTTTRSVYDGTDGPFMFGSDWSTAVGTEANCTFSAEITVYNMFDDGGTCFRSQFVFECAHTVPYTGIEIVRGACQPNSGLDQEKKIIELSLVFSGSGGTGGPAANGECIICGLN